MRREAKLEEAGRAAARMQNARLICPTPGKTSYGNEGSAQGSADAMAAKSGRPWESYRCTCRRFHVRPTVAQCAEL